MSRNGSPLSNDQVWDRKLTSDRLRAQRFLTGPLGAFNREIVERAMSLGADAIALTGSTARGKRTLISDLDYLIVGSKPRVQDLFEEIDLHTASADRFLDRLARGDSFTHWTLDYGCILWDKGVLREGLLMKHRQRLAADPHRLFRQFVRARSFAAEIVESGDSDAAQRETLSAMSLGARWWLLTRDVSPLARSELPFQLRATGNLELAGIIEQLIYGQPAMAAQATWLATAIADQAAPIGSSSLGKDAS